MQQDLMTSAQAAEYHGVHVSTWNRWVNTYEVALKPAFRDKRYMLFHRADVEAFDPKAMDMRYAANRSSEDGAA